jgi:hypothetical protein
VAVNLITAGLTLAAFLLLYPHAPRFAGVAFPSARLAFAARQTVWPALVLLAMVVGAMVARVSTFALNPIDDAESRFFRISQRVLANSVEQTTIFVPALWTLAILAPAERLGGAVAVGTGLFVLGRLLFWIGYLVHPVLRAPGMAMTFTVNLCVVGWAALLALE